MRAYLKEELTFKIECLLLDSQKELLKPLRSLYEGSAIEEPEFVQENETRNFYTPTKSVEIR